ncbi:FAD-binding oxidoreductase [Promicromonospora kroppenstedtii]|uniref:FAD-binding oxidoreductase n=1 Tax=Promicromonospora kroppenstedtii TaxID=440482 RepID=A0ABW7XET6_9MICO
MPPQTLDADRLRADLHGRLVLPGEPDWDDARRAWQLTADQHPDAVVLAATESDAIATVNAAREAGLRVAAQSTGHNAGPLGPLAGTILLRTSGLASTTTDVAAGTVRVEAGVTWGALTAAVAPHGLSGLPGTAADVGVVGYTLGGGLSWLGRAHGLASNHVISADVVTADGVLRHVDAVSDPELFWAIRGGGGSFAVVTALEISLVRVPDLHGGTLFFPLERASEVLHAWREWTGTAPDEITSLGRLLRFPPLPELPEAVRGRSFAVVELVSLLGQEATDAALAPLRALVPDLDTASACGPAELAAIHMDPPAPVPATGDGFLLRDLPAAALDAFLSVTGPDQDFPVLGTEIRHLGGALAPAPSAEGARGGAVSALDAGYAVFSAALTPDEAAAKAAHGHLDALRAALDDWVAPTSYLNFTERPGGAPFADADTLARLRRVKHRYDPTDLVRGNHPVEPSAG